MNLSDGLLERARQRAIAERRTVTSLVEDGLRLLLDGNQSGSPTRLPTVGAGGHFLIDLDDKDAVQDLFDEEDIGNLDRRAEPAPHRDDPS